MVKYIIKIPNLNESQNFKIHYAERLELAFPIEQALFERAGANLVLKFDNGSQVQLEGFFVRPENELDGQAELPTFIMNDGNEVQGEVLLKMIDPEFDISPAAGPEVLTPGSAIGAYADGAGEMIGGLEGLGKLGAITWENAKQTENPSDGGLLLANLEAGNNDLAGHSSIGSGPGNSGPDDSGTGDSGPGESGVGPDESNPDGNGNEHPTTPIANYSARAVYYNTNENTAGKVNFYLLDENNEPVHFEAGMEFSAKSQNGLFANILNPSMIKVNADGSLYLELSEQGKNALLNAVQEAGSHADAVNIYDYITITLNGREYVMQVVLNQSGNYNSANEDSVNPPDMPLYGEWHTGLSGTLQSERHTGDGNDEMWLSGAMQSNAGQKNIIDLGRGDNQLTQNGNMTAQNGGSNTITASTGKDTITINGQMYSYMGGKNTIDTVTGMGNENEQVTITNGTYAYGAGSKNEIFTDGNLNVNKTSTNNSSLSSAVKSSSGGETEIIADGIITVNSQGGIAYGVDSSDASSNMYIRAGHGINVNAQSNTTAYAISTNNGGRLNMSSQEGDINLNATSSTRNAVGVGGSRELSIMAQNGNININAHGHTTATGLFGSGFLSAAGLINFEVEAETGLAEGLHTHGTSIANLSALHVKLDVKSKEGSAEAITVYDRSSAQIHSAQTVELNASSGGAGYAYGMHVSRANNQLGTSSTIASKEMSVSATANGSGDARAMYAEHGYLTQNWTDMKNENLVFIHNKLQLNAEANSGNASAMYADLNGVNKIYGNGEQSQLNVNANSATGNSYGMQAVNTGQNLVQAMHNVSITVGAEHAPGEAHAMHAQAGAHYNKAETSNTILDTGSMGMVVSISAKSGDMDKAIAMWAEGRGAVNRIEGSEASFGGDVVNITGNLHTDSFGKNQIITHNGNDQISIHGNIDGKGNMINSGAGDDIITLHGKIEAGALNIFAGENGHDTLVLVAQNMAEFYENYHSWLDQLGASGRASMDIESIKVQADGATDADLSWLKAMFPDADFSWENYSSNLNQLFNISDNDDLLIYTNAYEESSDNAQGLHMQTPEASLEQEGLQSISLHDINDMLHGFDIIDLRNTQEHLTVDSLLGELKLENPMSLNNIEVRAGDSDLAEKLSEGSVLRVHADENGKVNLEGNGWDAVESKVGSVAYDGFEYEVYQNDVNNDQFILIQANMLVC